MRIAGYNLDVATLEIDRARAGHLPTVDLVASAGQNWGSGSLANDFRFDSRSAQIGVVLNVPIYQGGFVDSRVRETIALQDQARQNLEVARRTRSPTRRSVSPA